MGNKGMPWQEAIIEVMSESPGEAFRPRDISDEILSRGLKTTKSAKPQNTVVQTITASIKDEGEVSPFIRVSRGFYRLREDMYGSGDKKQVGLETPAKPSSSGNGECDDLNVIKAFGMFWRRSDVLWQRQPKLLGAAHLDSGHIDFSEQYGVYLLYDGREVIYVGRCNKRPIGTRLFEHTQDRLSARWDRFSWFGLKSVNKKGGLRKMESQPYDPEQLISALESLLIEAIEPRQNRKRGDDLAMSEYIQIKDPVIEEKEKRDVLQDMLYSSCSP